MGNLPYPSPTNTGEWAKDLLTELGDPLTASNVSYLESWQAAESPSGYGYNPLGTKQTEAGSVNANSAGVQAFKSWAQGLQATVTTFTAYAGNSALLSRLHQGNATVAQLDAAQASGSWATGAEPHLSGQGSSTPFTYGGSMGEQPGASGVATASGGGIDWNPLHYIAGIGGPHPVSPSGAVSAVEGIPGDIVSGIFGPITGWIEKGAADVTFIGFGLLLIVIGLVVTFKSETQSVVEVAGKGAEVVGEGAAAS